jgi:hypothetical protein
MIYATRDVFDEFRSIELNRSSKSRRSGLATLA